MTSSSVCLRFVLILDPRLRDTSAFLTQLILREVGAHTSVLSVCTRFSSLIRSTIQSETPVWVMDRTIQKTSRLYTQTKGVKENDFPQWLSKHRPVEDGGGVRDIRRSVNFRTTPYPRPVRLFVVRLKNDSHVGDTVHTSCVSVQDGERWSIDSRVTVLDVSIERS